MAALRRTDLGLQARQRAVLSDADRAGGAADGLGGLLGAHADDDVTLLVLEV